MKTNPIKQARLDVNMSIVEMAAVANVSHAAIGQLEAGFYPEPLPAVLTSLGIPPGSDRLRQITEDYKTYQLETRRANGPLFGVPRLIELPVFNLEIHPLEDWRKQSSLPTYTLCAAYCIHMPLVNRFEKHITNCSEIPPTQIYKALDDAGYDLDEFTEACLIYKATLLNNSLAANGLISAQLSLISLASLVALVWPHQLINYPLWERLKAGTA